MIIWNIVHVHVYEFSTFTRRHNIVSFFKRNLCKEATDNYWICRVLVIGGNAYTLSKVPGVLSLFCDFHNNFTVLLANKCWYSKT